MRHWEWRLGIRMRSRARVSVYTHKYTQVCVHYDFIDCNFEVSTAAHSNYLDEPRLAKHRSQSERNVIGNSYH